MIDQDRIIDFLSSAQAYQGEENEGDDELAVQRRETHISVIFLVGNSAYKMKRAVSYPYLDFSTLERRRYLCSREVEINSRTAPDIYRGVVPVTQDENGHLTLGGDGEPVEWLVFMHRFDDSSLWDLRAQDGSLERRDLEILADQVAGFHTEAVVCNGEDAVKRLGHTIDEIEQCMAEHTGELFDLEDVESLLDRTRLTYDSLLPVLQERAGNGSVRICHGDLHLGNIYTGEAGPVLFDAIEFNDDFSHIDILYDLAFLLMDVDYRVGKRRATVLMNRYLDHSGDVTGVRVVPFFMSIRASIRAHVSASAAKLHADPDKSIELAHHAMRYFERASACLKPATPRLIAVGGLSGSGKSRMARVVAGVLDAVPGARVVRSDTVRKRLAGIRFEEHLPPDSYTPEASSRTYAACLDEARQVLQSGCPVVLDAVFAKPEERAAAQALVHETGISFEGLWLEAPVSVMRERVESRQHNASDANAGVVDQQTAYDLGDIQWRRIDSSGEKKKTEIAVYQCLGLDHGLL